MGGGDAISVQEVCRKTHRGRKEEGGETVRTGGESAFSCTSLCISIEKNTFVTVHGIEIVAYSVMVHFHNHRIRVQ
jgi:hypothetical protein